MPHPNAARLRGSLTAIMTPFDAQGRLTLEHFPALLDFQRQQKMDGVVVCGTNGEAASLSVAERKQALEAVMANREGLLVVAGTGAASITDALELTRHAAQVGADAALVLPPFFLKKPTAQGLAYYFLPLLDATDLPLLLYSIPQMTAIRIEDDLIDLLIDHPNLVGIKDSEGDWERTSHLITRYPNLQIFPGSDFLAAQGYAQGCPGVISGTANSFPDLLAAIRDGHRNDPTGAQRDAAQERLNSVLHILIKYPLFAMHKTVIEARGLPRLYARPPLINLTPAQDESLLSELRAAGYL